MRFALIRELTKSYKASRDSTEWKRANDLAQIELSSNAEFNLINKKALIYAVVFISFLLISFTGFDNTGSCFVISMSSLILGFYYSNKKLSLIDDAALKHIKNGLTSR
jgi:hypothetical protein